MNTKTYKWFYDNIHSHYYNLMIKWFALPLGGETRFRKKMIKPISFKPGEKILEMCCGTGGATVFIAEKANNDCEIIGMDLSSGQLKHAQKRKYCCKTSFIEGDVTITGFHENSFDKVFITHAIHEMSREARLKTLREAKRVLKNDGEIIILELDNPPNLFLRLLAGAWGLYWLPGNFETPTRRDMLKHGLVNEVKESGFVKVEKCSAYSGILQTVIGVKRTSNEPFT